MKITKTQQKLLKKHNLDKHHLLILKIVHEHQKNNNGEGISKDLLIEEFKKRQHELNNLEYEV